MSSESSIENLLKSNWLKDTNSHESKMATTPFPEHNFIYSFALDTAGDKCNTYCWRVLMLETISGNIMMIQGYIQGQKINLKVKFIRKCVI